MSSLEFTHWLAFYSKEPWGYDMDNWRHGMVAATVANVAPRKKGAKSLKPLDFCPSEKRQSKGLTARQEKELAARGKRKGKGKK